ncbi:venom protease [Manduca sexta]|uniref:Phenoloxidase-activating factor 2 n=1 Tax=Manduca sexta TaxID=7130 RepID=A0A921YZU5_MANSE|nr:venom protease [Manduca sexta]KAG6448119.1 hypothetical protein O3G_MSEX005331 [Manduca sexta]KAG6448120.1 hypothetical protein O3G_MSEX005331 [Manduca sexta]
MLGQIRTWLVSEGTSLFGRMIFVFLLLLVSVCAEKGDYSELQHPAWEDIIEEGGMHIGGGRSKRFIQLNPNQGNVAYQACTLPSGKQGHCRHLRFCIQEDFKQDFVKFMNYVCVIQGQSMGVCCPEDTTVGGPEGLAGDLPATAPQEGEDETLLKINQAQNRGCGLSTRAQGRVFGSRPANPREWPWMASITPEGFEQYCGGVLITDRHVLTAAHCTRRWEANELYVRLGEYDFKRTNDTRSYNFRVVEKVQHVDFEISNYHHDIAILKLDKPAIFNTYVWPICLPPPGLSIENETVTVIGWGTQWYGGPHSHVLMEVSFPIWTHQNCIEVHTNSIFDESICAGGHEGGRDACQGDSGGPLMYQMPSGRWAVVGIVSWGVRCGEPNHPGIYTRVDKYIGWIMENARF